MKDTFCLCITAPILCWLKSCFKKKKKNITKPETVYVSVPKHC